MRWIWLRCRPCQCMQPDKRLVLQLDWLQSDVLAAIDAEPIVRSALIGLNNEVVMATRPTPNSGVWERRQFGESVFECEWGFSSLLLQHLKVLKLFIFQQHYYTSSDSMDVDSWYKLVTRSHSPLPSTICPSLNPKQQPQSVSTHVMLYVVYLV